MQLKFKFFRHFPLVLFSILLLSCSETDFPGPHEIPPSDDISTDDSTTKTIKYLALGDSYTIGESVAQSDRWPVQLAARLDAEADITVDDTRIIARTGWTTGNLINEVSRIDLQPEYDLVSLLIGVNNQFQGRTLDEFRTGFEALLQRSIALAGGNKAHVFVVSIPDYGYTPFGQGNQSNISAGVDAFNEASKIITESYGIAFYDITPISQRGLNQPDYVANDGLHPSGVQYTAWVESFAAAVAAQVRN